MFIFLGWLKPIHFEVVRSIAPVFFSLCVCVCVKITNLVVSGST